MSSDKFKCKKCGCTDEDACLNADGYTCAWVEEDLCSFCAYPKKPKKAAKARKAKAPKAKGK